VGLSVPVPGISATLGTIRMSLVNDGWTRQPCSLRAIAAEITPLGNHEYLFCGALPCYEPHSLPLINRRARPNVHSISVYNPSRRPLQLPTKYEPNLNHLPRVCRRFTPRRRVDTPSSLDTSLPDSQPPEGLWSNFCRDTGAFKTLEYLRKK